MRTHEQLQIIKDNHSDPVQLCKVIHQDKINDLLKYYHANDPIEKNTGPKVLYVEEGQGIIDDIIESLRVQFDNFKVRSAHFFEVTEPHILHIDDGKDLPNAYKAFTIPLYTEGAHCSAAKLVMFDQYYYGGPVKFMQGGPVQKKNYYNTHLYEYSKVENTNNKGISQTFKNVYLSHLRDNWLNGLSVQAYFPWDIGSVICFDSLQIHSASNFKTAGITKKIGLSIFTVI